MLFGPREIMASSTAGMILCIEGWNAWSISNLTLERAGGPDPRVVGTGKCSTGFQMQKYGTLDFIKESVAFVKRQHLGVDF